MARINIEEAWWTDPRRRMLARLVNSEAIADGLMVGVWRIAQQYRGRGAGCIPHHIWETIEGGPSIIQANLASIQADGVYVRGSGEHLDWVLHKRAIASEGGKKSAQRPRNAKGQLEKASKQTPSKSKAPSKTVQPSGSGSVSGSSSESDSVSGSGKVSEGGSNPPSVPESEPVTKLIWNAYSNAYRTRYGVDPIRNAQVNAQIKSFSEKVPFDEAPAIAKFFVEHNKPYYVSSLHDVGALLKDATGLRTQWATDSKVTVGDSRNAEFKDTLTNQLKRLGGAS